MDLVSATLSAPHVPADRTAATLRGFGPVGIGSILVILLAGNVAVSGLPVAPIGATLALLWTWRSRTPWREIGFAPPRSWLRTLALGVVFGSVLKMVMKMIVMPLLGAPPVNQAFQFLAANEELLPVAMWAMLVAGLSEEVVFRGFLFERAGTLFGRGRIALTAIVVVTSVWFGLQHYAGQGWPGVQQATVVGLVFGAVFVRTRNLWVLIVAHTAFDLAALAMIYWGVEADVAGFVFGPAPL